MSLQGDIVWEGMVAQMCERLVPKISEYSDHPEAVKALKELGREIITTLPNIPTWAYHYLDHNFHK
ncbi:MAG: hypothetical protein C3F02_01235 [Parcubacteria group bacterium]|nr:MAG: hypothetical protein C3F02_01235 [Parcubacteria group bacterium]